MMFDMRRRRDGAVLAEDGQVVAEAEATVATDEALLALQRAAPVPLELDVLAGVVRTPQTPVQLVNVVRSTLGLARRFG
jgi:hypothetical protein